MATHLSARLAWHDRSWDGRICDHPHLNSSCIVLQHIRDTRRDEDERKAAAQTFDQLKGWLPPCSRDASAYSPHKGFEVHRDPLDFRALPSVSEEIPQYSCCPSPYRWLREENFRSVCEAENLTIRGPDMPREVSWIMEPDRQRELLKHFWEKIEPKKSLIFYYCNQGNPLDENTSRIIVGVGRIAKISPQLYFGTKPRYEDQYPIWARCVTQDYPEQGVRIPYQEYLRGKHDPENIICRVPSNALMSFSFVGEHVSDGVAISIIERVIHSIEQVAADQKVAGDWSTRLAWLNDVLAELWTQRGPFPGLGSVLQYLGFARGTAYHRLVLSPMLKKGVNPWEHVHAILEGRAEPDKDLYEKGLLTARQKWNERKSRQELLSKLMLFELTVDQVERIANPDLRAKSGIEATEAELVTNPYLISESDWGSSNSDAVALEAIDQGILPEGDAALFRTDDKPAKDDSRRVRAITVAVLKEAQDEGDTVLPLGDLLERVEKYFPDKRACRLDREVFSAQRDHFAQRLWTALDGDVPLVALKDLRKFEEQLANVVKRRAPKANSPPSTPLDWKQALKAVFGKAETQRENAALAEKETALQTLFSRRLSVLTGGAGTGKTSVLKVFLDEVERVEGRHPMLLLSPTGKARVRLATRTGRNAMTIHQFLLKQKWFVPDLFVLKTSSSVTPFCATTVVIDECSMIPSDLFGALIQALDMGPLTRLILVGDPNQLPPIGPGRPFIDIIEWLSENRPECVASLKLCMRTNQGDANTPEESVALAFADGYRAVAVSVGDDEILADIAKGNVKGDLEVEFWKDHDELQSKLKQCLQRHVGIKEADYVAFNRSLGIDTKDYAKSEAWQILTPTRLQHFGTDGINRAIQKEFKGGLIRQANDWRRGMPKPFGDQEIVFTDKVIQIHNRSVAAWPRNTGLDYVANGEIGIVTNTTKNENGGFLDVVFSSQTEVSYRYFRTQVDEYLELAYALTVHKAQGSDFDVVYLVIPQKATTLSRELIYTGLTRFRKKLVLLLEKDIAPLLRLRSPDASNTRLRNTQMFKLGLRPTDYTKPHLEALIHRTRKGVAVRSKSEVIVANILDSLGIWYEYEKVLVSRSDPRDFRLPDFTVGFEGDIFYWEHLGMLTVPSYREAWERKQKWYEAQGYAGQLITSEDGPDGSIDAARIETIARKRILQE